MCVGELKKIRALYPPSRKYSARTDIRSDAKLLRGTVRGDSPRGLYHRPRLLRGAVPARAIGGCVHSASTRISGARGRAPGPGRHTLSRLVVAPLRPRYVTPGGPRAPRRPRPRTGRAKCHAIDSASAIARGPRARFRVPAGRWRVARHSRARSRLAEKWPTNEDVAMRVGFTTD